MRTAMGRYRNANTTAACSSSHRDPSVEVSLMRSSISFLKPLGNKQETDHQYQHAQRNSSAQRPVVGGSKKAHDNIGNHDATRAAQQQRSQEISQAQYESKRRPSQNARNRQRKDHTPERLERRCA